MFLQLMHTECQHKAALLAQNWGTYTKRSLFGEQVEKCAENGYVQLRGFEL